ncbi:MAG: aspartate carbamoyltransferase regulatory subunit [Alphaproteobacteria bacterium]|nr:aspartate carbamoyltransferase regulatory subunit [Alphaproteobacteria bacterium]
MLNVDKIKDGIVIDHITPGCGYRIFQELELAKLSYNVALLLNVSSQSSGTKDLIKIANVRNLDMTRLGLIDPNLTINIIENEKIKEKLKLAIPEKVLGIMTCKNPRCISNNSDIGKIEFTLMDKDKKLYKCEYCDALTSY